MTIWLPSHVRPSYATGYARSASESASPNLWQDLLAAWCPNLGATGLTLRDHGPKQQHGTLTSMAAGSSWVSPGHERLGGPVLTFDGSADYVDTNTSFTTLGQSGGSFTVSAWAKNHGTPSTREGIVSSYASAGSIGFDLRYETTTPIDGFVFSTGHWSINAAAMAVSEFTLTEWNHIVGVYEAGVGIQVRVNGVQGGTTDTGDNDSAARNIDIGADFGRSASRYWDGEIGPVFLWDRVLRPDEIWQLYTDPLAPFRRRIYLPLAEAAAAPPGTTGVKNPFMGPFSLPLQGSI